VNEKNVEKARKGSYPKTIETEVSETRLKRFFLTFEGNYQVAKTIRDMCVFAKQDITADPPFSNMDLISCRNMLIYFDEHLHERVVPTLHYALKVGGFLVLGESESIGKFTQLFELVSKKGSIYIKKRAQPSITFGFQASEPCLSRRGVREDKKIDALAVLKDEVDRLLVTEYVPAALLVNADLDVLVFRGKIAPYVLPESGLASLNLAKILRKDLRSEVHSIIYRARKEEKPVRENAVRFEYSGEQKTINIQVVPLHVEQFEAPFFLLMFEDVSSAAALLRLTKELTSTNEGRENFKDRQIIELREELDSTKQTLQKIIETQEATNEELRTTMEEAQSTNEELQSTNEELETAKEELQSSNEELKTLNDEVKNRNETLAQLNDDLINLTKNMEPVIVIIERSLKIRLFSPSARKILNFLPSSVGLPITNVKMGIKVEDLGEMISEVISKLNSIQ
jgi:two-component system CheB/CheR fusion protein